MQKLIESRFIAGPNDALATEDVYEVTESAIRSRAAGFGDGELAKLAGALRIPFEPDSSPDESPIMDIIAALLSMLMDRVKSFLSKMSPSTRDTMPSNIDVTMDEVGYAELDLFWDFMGEKIYIDPRDQKTYEMSRALTNDARQKDPQYLEMVEEATDQAAETIVYSKAIELMIGADIVAPIGTILNGLSSDAVRQKVAERNLKTAINPSGDKKGPSFRTLVNAESNPLNTDSHKRTTADRILNSNTGTRKKPLNPWDTTDRSPFDNRNVNRQEATGGVAGANLNNRVNWNTPPEDIYWNVYEDEDVLSLGRKVNPTNIPGFRDNVGTWVRSDISTGKGINWEALDELRKWASPSFVLRQFPGILNMILYYYRLPSGEYSLADEYNKVVDLMGWLKEDWAYVEKQNDIVGRLQYFSNASKDAYYLFTTYTESEHRDKVMIASRYLDNNIVSLLKVQFPLTAI